MRLLQLFWWHEFEHMWHYMLYYFALFVVVLSCMFLIISEIKKRYDE